MNDVVAYASPFVPAEWIAAHGHRPVRVPVGRARGSSGAGTGIEGGAPGATILAGRPDGNPGIP
jgi:hypothetical protein